MNWAAMVWLALMIGFLFVEASTVSLASIWFAVGSLIAAVAAFWNAPVWLQVTLFFAVSAVLLLLLRPMTKKYFTPKLTKTNVDSVIGSEGLVTGRISNVEAAGQVKLGAMEWTARSTTGEVIEPGTRVRVDKIEGVKAFVTPVEVKVK